MRFCWSQVSILNLREKEEETKERERERENEEHKNWKGMRNRR